MIEELIAFFGIHPQQLIEAGAKHEDGRLIRTETEDEKIALGRALGYVLSQHFGRPELDPMDHPFAGSVVYLHRSGQWGWSLRKDFEVLQVVSDVSEEPEDAIGELENAIEEQLIQLETDLKASDFKPGDRVRHWVKQGLKGLVIGVQDFPDDGSCFLIVKWDDGSMGSMQPWNLHKEAAND
jgi:hypothetical protein